MTEDIGEEEEEEESHRIIYEYINIYKENIFLCSE